MTPQQITALAVRLFAIWLFITFVVSLPFDYVQFKAQLGSGVTAPYYAVVMILTIAIMVILWRFPLTVAGKLLSTEAREAEEPASPDLWLAMGCSLIGLWMLGSALPLVTQEIYLVSSGFLEGDTQLRFSLSRYVVQIVVAIWLMLGAKGFRKLFWWMRNAGRYQPEKDQ